MNEQKRMIVWYNLSKDNPSRTKGVMNGPLKFLTARKILPFLDLLAKFKRVLACSCSPNFCSCSQARKAIVFYFCSCSQKNRSARHARECSQRPFVTPNKHFLFSLKSVYNSARHGGHNYGILNRKSW